MTIPGGKVGGTGPGKQIKMATCMWDSTARGKARAGVGVARDANQPGGARNRYNVTLPLAQHPGQEGLQRREGRPPAKNRCLNLLS